MKVAANYTQIVDFSQVDALLQAAGRDGVNEIMVAFWRSTEDLATRLKAQLDAKDFAEAARTSHALKGSAANVGACLLSEAARSAELCCKNLDGAGARSALDALTDAYAQTRVALTSHIDAAA